MANRKRAFRSTITQATKKHSLNNLFTPKPVKPSDLTNWGQTNVTFKQARHITFGEVA